MAKVGRADEKLRDEMREMLEPLLPVPEPRAQPLGCHRRRVPDRKVLDGIFFVLRTGVPWKALDAKGICWRQAGHRHREDQLPPAQPPGCAFHLAGRQW